MTIGAKVPCDTIGSQYPIDFSAVDFLESDALKLRPEADNEVIYPGPLGIIEVTTKPLPSSAHRIRRGLNAEVLADRKVQVTFDTPSSILWRPTSWLAT